jgi:outer membrane putative beta-barrel porin/alpha-amylase
MSGRAALVCSLMIGLTAASELRACDSTGCLMVTRSAGGLLARKAFRVDFSFRATDDSMLMSGSDTTDRVTRPKIDFEHGLVRPGFHQDLGGTSQFVQLDLGYGLTGSTTLLASAPIVTHRSYDIGHPPVLTENYETWGLGDTLVGARHAFLTSAGTSLVAGLALEMPTGDFKLVSSGALFDIGVLDPMLQPGSGSWDFVGNVQAAHRLSDGGLDLTGAFSYQLNTTNDLEYRYGNDTIASTSLGGPVGSRVRASIQLKLVHRGRSTFQGEDVSSTGGSVVYAIPGLVTSLPGKMSFYLFLPVPVYRYVNESQLAPRLSVVVGMARLF